MTIDDYNDQIATEAQDESKKVNLFMGYAHSNTWGSPRRCRNTNCMEAFTPHAICPTCKVETTPLS